MNVIITFVSSLPISISLFGTYCSFMEQLAEYEWYGRLSGTFVKS